MVELERKAKEKVQEDARKAAKLIQDTQNILFGSTSPVLPAAPLAPQDLLPVLDSLPPAPFPRSSLGTSVPPSFPLLPPMISTFDALHKLLFAVSESESLDETHADPPAPRAASDDTMGMWVYDPRFTTSPPGSTLSSSLPLPASAS